MSMLAPVREEARVLDPKMGDNPYLPSAFYAVYAKASDIAFYCFSMYVLILTDIMVVHRTLIANI